MRLDRKRTLLAGGAAVALLAGLGCGGAEEDSASPATSGASGSQAAQRPDPSADRNKGMTRFDRAVKQLRPGAADVVDLGICSGDLRFLRKQLIGDSLAEVERAAGENCTVRVVELDGQAQPVTDDYVTTRLNVAVEDGDVTRVVGLF